MMKKVLAVLAVMAMVCMSSMAFAADVTMGGTMEIMSRMYQDLDQNSKGTNNDEVRTLERVRVDLNAKAGDVKGKITLENDFATWGSGPNAYLGQNEAYPSTVTNVATGTTPTTKVSTLGIREAWMLFPVADTGIFVKAGHMNFALGQGQFASQMRYGADAWIAYKDIDTMHFGLVNWKVGESSVSKADNDTDAYVVVATNKMGDALAGLDFTTVKMRGIDTTLYNLGLNYKGNVGPVALKAELDIQAGSNKSTGTSQNYKGNLLYVNGAVNMNPVTVNFTLARGTGEKSGSGIDQFQNFIDTNGHYTLIYEYMIETAAGNGVKNSGFVNTTALSAGAMFAATKNLNVGADVWMLQATEKTNVNGGTASNDAGTEIDAKLNWKLADNVSWNWTLGYFMPGAMYKNAAGTAGKDATTGLQGMLTMTM